MNEHTAKVLDYDLIRDELQTYTVTPMGHTLARQLQPHADRALLDIQLRETSEMADLLAAGDDLPLASVADLRVHVEAAQLAGYYLEGQQLLEVADCLEVLQQLRRFTRHNSQRIPLLTRRLAPLSDFSIFLRQIRSALDERGAVRDSASPLLQEIRRTLNHTSERIHRTLLRLMATHSSVVQDAVVTIRNDRFVVPLKTDFRRALQGIVHGEVGQRCHPCTSNRKAWWGSTMICYRPAPKRNEPYEKSCANSPRDWPPSAWPLNRG